MNFRGTRERESEIEREREGEIEKEKEREKEREKITFDVPIFWLKTAKSEKVSSQLEKGVKGRKQREMTNRERQIQN